MNELYNDAKEYRMDNILENFLINLLQLCFANDSIRSIVLN